MEKSGSKLPFFCSDITFEGEDLIQTEYGTTVGEIYNSQDTKYILEATNNYPRAVELLKNVLKKEYISNVGIDYEIDEFLKSINEE